MCEILDYRYARTLSGASQMIDPYIHRGLWRDVHHGGVVAGEPGGGHRSGPKPRR